MTDMGQFRIVMRGEIPFVQEFHASNIPLDDLMRSLARYRFNYEKIKQNGEKKPPEVCTA